MKPKIGSAWQLKNGKFRGYFYTDSGKRKYITAKSLREAREKIEALKAN